VSDELRTEESEAAPADHVAELIEPATAAATPSTPQRDHLSSEIDEVKELAADLRSVLPTRIEAAVSRAVDAHKGAPVDHRVAELHLLAIESVERTRALTGEVRADRVGRVEDLEVVVDLLAEGLGAVRSDIARLEVRSQRIERELERLTWALDRVGSELARLSLPGAPPAPPG